MSWGVSETKIITEYYSADKIKREYKKINNSFWNGVRDGKFSEAVAACGPVMSHYLAIPLVATVVDYGFTAYTVRAALNTFKDVIEGRKWTEMLKEMESNDFRGAMKVELAVRYVQGTDVITSSEIVNYKYGKNY